MATRTPKPEGSLRELAAAHEQAQRIRITSGEQVRSALAAGGSGAGSRPAESALDAIRRGDSDGPVPELGRAYREHWEAEQRTAQQLEQCIAEHPAWSWLGQVPGVGPALAGRLLARLDVRRAPTPSSFWNYCGLGTAPAVRYHCSTCGLSRSAPESQRVRSEHRRLDRTGWCAGSLVPVAGPEQGVRAAQPRPLHGARPGFDPQARMLCYLIGSSLARADGGYARYYAEQRRRLTTSRSGWRETRLHMAALRKTEKLFLVHLWLVWRTAEGLPITRPNERAPSGDPWSDPWAMIAAPARRRWARGEHLPDLRIRV